MPSKIKPLTERLNDHFTDAADWISSAMGTPANIGIWFAVVAVWFLLFMVNPALQNSSFLPAWFTSQAFNFPLNSITTLAELYIGFLVAAASNRIERRNHAQMVRLDRMEAQMLRMERQHGAQLKALQEVLADLHSHTTCAGHTTIGDAERPTAVYPVVPMPAPVTPATPKSPRKRPAKSAPTGQAS